MAEDTGDRPIPERVREAILAAAKRGHKPKGPAPEAGPAMDAAIMRATTGILAERMIEANAPK